jgi:hypothetical protein
MRGGHPARSRNALGRITKTRFSRPGAVLPALGKLTAETGNRK